MTWACFQSSGRLPSFTDLLNNILRGSANSFASSLSTLDGIPSGPVALLASSFFNLSSIAFGVIMISVIVIPFEYLVGSSSGSSFLFSI